jgi:hypothetical protein
MSNFPERLTVGPTDCQTTYELIPNQVLIRINEDVNEEELATFLGISSSEASTEPAYLQRARRTLDPAGLRWVTLPSGGGRNFARVRGSLEERSDIEEVRPIYFASGGGPETAATPMFETVMVQIEDDQVDEVLESISALGLIYNEAFSAALAPTAVFNFADDFDLNIENALAVATEVSNLPGVQSVEFDWLKLETYQLTPNDTLFSNQWNITTISAEGAWDIETGNSNVWIAIIDSGFDLGHPDLNFTPNTAANPTHCNADDFINGNPTPYNAGSSGVFHGTACAGIAAATINNNRGVAGVAGGCQIMPVRLGTIPTSARVAAGINWARINGAAVGSLSLGTPSTTAVVNAVVNAWNAGMILCAATGNDGDNTSSPPINFPANHVNTIAVGASDLNDQRKRPASSDGECWGSQFGAEIDVVAPGVQIWSTDEQGPSGYNDNSGGAINWACVDYTSSGDTTGDYVAVFDGTSAATPHVAGLAALIMSANPSLTNQQVRDLIESTCDKVSPGLYAYANTPGRPNGTWHQEVGYGRINVSRAVCNASQSIDLQTLSIQFNDVPEGEQTARAIVFSVTTCLAATFEIVSGPTVTGGPGSFGTLPSPNATLPATGSLSTREARLWLSFTGTDEGDITTGEVTVRLVETGEEWPISISANTIARPTVATVLCLDQSGSMQSPSGLAGFPTRNDVLKFAAPVFINVLQEDNGIGIVAFDDNAYNRMNVAAVGPPSPFDPARSNALGVIGSHTPNPSGLTAIGDAIEEAVNRLNATAGYDQEAIIVLTDGHETAAKYIADVAPLINERIFAIGLGTANQIQPAALTALTNGTGGYLLLTGTVGPDDLFLLSKYYLQILAGVTNQDIVLDPEGAVKPGQKHRIPFQLNEADVGVDTILMAETSLPVFRFALESPAGDLIDPGIAGATPSIDYISAQGVTYYRMTLPVPIGAGARSGKWHAVLTVDDVYYKRYLATLDNFPELYNQVKAHGVRYSLSVQSYSGLRLQAQLLQDSLEPGANLTVRAVLTEYGIPIGSDRAKVRAEFERPDKTGGLLTLNETEVGSGIYTANLPALLSGVYRFRILANGSTMRGRTFTREHLLTGAVWQGGDNPPPTSTDDPREDKERFCHLLSCLVSEKVMQPEFEKRLKELGIDINVLRSCIKTWCKRPRSNSIQRSTQTGVAPTSTVLSEATNTANTEVSSLSPVMVDLIRQLAKELENPQ